MNRLEQLLREELSDLESRLGRGKGEWPHQDYISDLTWYSWCDQRNLLLHLLRRAGEEDDG